MVAAQGVHGQRRGYRAPALGLAVPAFAQTAPAADPHAQHKGMDHSQHDAGKNNPDRIVGWYNLAGGGAGFLIVEYDNIDELTGFLQPYMDPLSFDVRAINQVDYDERIEALRRLVNQGARSPV